MVERRRFLGTVASAGLVASQGCFPTTLSSSFRRMPNKSSGVYRVGFGSCFDVRRRHNVWSGVLKSKSDAFLSMGDNVYARDGKMSDLVQNYKELKSIPAYRKLNQSNLMLATWDDHDYGMNNGGADFPLKEESQKIFYDFLERPKNDPARSQEGVYFATSKMVQGRKVKFILLDLRYGQKPTGDENAKIMSQAQWSWLSAELQEKADLTVLVSSIQFLADEHPFEKWADFGKEKEKLMSLITKKSSQPLLILSGDRHFHEFATEVQENGVIVNEITSSGMNRGTPSKDLLKESNRHRIWRSGGNGFGMLDISFDSKGKPQVMSFLLDDTGSVKFKRPLAFSV